MENTSRCLAPDQLASLVGTETDVSGWFTVTQDDVDRLTVEIEGEAKPALVAEWLNMSIV